jgi:FkbM family methyltransferase
MGTSWMSCIKRLIKAVLPYGVIVIYRRLRNRNELANVRLLDFNFKIFDDFETNNHGEEGEDILLRLFLKKQTGVKGFYVDIGAFHPTNMSNTKYFYDIGWNGINIDANPASLVEFNKSRDRDINISCGVSDEYGELDYYYFGENDTINTFNKEQANEFEKLYNKKVAEIKKIPVEPINKILEKHCASDQHIDFITIDVEGFEMRILQSFDFQKYAPDYFLVEDLEHQNKSLQEFKTGVLYKFLKSKGYNVVGKTKRLTYLFQKENIC